MHHLCVHQAMNRLLIHMCDQVSLPEPGAVGWTSLLHVLQKQPS